MKDTVHATTEASSSSSMTTISSSQAHDANSTLLISTHKASTKVVDNKTPQISQDLEENIVILF
jgi:hypothetical protein